MHESHNPGIALRRGLVRQAGAFERLYRAFLSLGPWPAVGWLGTARAVRAGGNGDAGK